MNEPEYRRYDPWEPFPYCDCGRIMRDGTCRVCQAEPLCASCGRWTDPAALFEGECLGCRNLRVMQRSSIPITDKDVHHGGDDE